MLWRAATGQTAVQIIQDRPGNACRVFKILVKIPGRYHDLALFVRKIRHTLIVVEKILRMLVTPTNRRVGGWKVLAQLKDLDFATKLRATLSDGLKVHESPQKPRFLITVRAQCKLGARMIKIRALHDHSAIAAGPIGAIVHFPG
ncbi:hypothetical protein [Marivita sp.]|uniref:hypothetical protein n=1 Tax=Marivita sp. TaxID=2003365 RepID=UPI003F6B7121